MSKLRHLQINNLNFQANCFDSNEGKAYPDDKIKCRMLMPNNIENDICGLVVSDMIQVK